MTSRTPYTDAAPKRVWRSAIADVPAGDVDPAEGIELRIAPTDKVVTIGSCFAQHLSRRLKDGNFNFFVTEKAHPVVSTEVAQAHHFGVFTARYGNIYTARQMLQLLRRAYGRFSPADDAWEEDGRWYDPFRPQIQPGGWATRLEYDLDRKQHFAAVRRAFEEMDVLICTLGLTEAWVSRIDGAVYTICPGAAAGTFDPAKHAFHNFTVEEVIADLREFLAELRDVNPRVETVFTVSPLPLVATAEDQHVLTATTYSKSVLRVAAGVLAGEPGVHYFPSYEIGTGAFSRGRYYAENVRSFTEEGVDHVMRLFFKHVTQGGDVGAPRAADPKDDYLERSAAAAAALCDEERLDPSP